MGLFEVPGWSVPSGGPVSESSPSPSSKKRKRGSLDSFDSRFKTAEANLDKLMQKFRGSSSSETSGPSTSKTSPKSGSVLKTALSKHEERKKEKKSQAHEEKKKLISHPRPLKPSTPASKTQHQRPKHHHRQNSDASTTASLVPSPPKKKLKTDHDVSQKTVKFALDVSDDNRGLTKLQKEMQQSLGGARFRLVQIMRS
jgi:hypothetical protein